MANSATLYVVDKQMADGSWQGVASMWEEIDSDILAAILAVFKDNDQEGTYRLVTKVRTETLDETVIG